MSNEKKFPPVGWRMKAGAVLRGYGAEEAAAALGWSRAVLYEMWNERRLVRPDELHHYAVVLGLNVHWLRDGSGDPLGTGRCGPRHAGHRPEGARRAS